MFQISGRGCADRTATHRAGRARGWLWGGLTTFLAVCAGAAGADHPQVNIKNTTGYTMRGTVEYLWPCGDDNYTVRPGQTWTASDGRGICLVSDISGALSGGSGGRGAHGESLGVVPYDSTGTAYAKFLVSAYGGRYRIFSEDEHARAMDTRSEGSPGFRFVNKTEWPLAYSLDQVGCLYHGIVPVGTGGGDGVYKVNNAGAVWFTLRVHIQPDGRSPQSDWDCVEPVAEVLGDVAMGVLTGGTTAAGKFVVKTAAKAAIKAAAKSITTGLVKDMTAEELGRLLTRSASVTMYGQYAGYDRPFRCDRMPEYHITGGPTVVRDESGNTYIRNGAPFAVKKVNDCGNDMMLGSVKEASADRPEFFSHAPTALPCEGADCGGVAPAAGAWMKVVNRSWNKCLNLRKVNASDGRSPDVYHCSPQADQEWRLLPSSRGACSTGPDCQYYQIQNKSWNMCLNLQTQGNRNRGIPNVWTCQLHPDQEWELIALPDGFHKLRNRNWSRCLNLEDKDNRDQGTPNVWACSPHSDQEWRFEPL